MPHVHLEVSKSLPLEQARNLEKLLRENGWTDLAQAIRRSIDAGMLTDDEYAALFGLLAGMAEHEEADELSAPAASRVAV